MTRHASTAVASAALGLLLIAAVAAAQPTVAPADPADQLLAVERWQEQAYGLSFRPPLGCTMQTETSGDTLVRFAGPEGYSVEVYIRQVKPDMETGEFLSADPDRPDAPPTRIAFDNRQDITLDIEQVVEMALSQVAVAHPGATVLAQDRLAPADRSAAVVYFRLPNETDGRTWILGHAYMMLDDQSFVWLRLLAPQGQFAAIRQTFEAVVKSLDLQDPAVRDQQRRDAIQRGQALRATIDTAKLHKAIVDKQWLRIVQDGADIGYMLIKQHKDTQLGFPGLSVEIQARVQLDRQILDSDSSFFLSDDGNHELWSIRNSVRPTPAPGSTPAPGRTPGSPDGGAQAISTADTGVRTNDAITVTVDLPTSSKKYTWIAPPEGYLSQVEVNILPSLLPPRKSEPLGFYAYYPAAGKITYRTMTVQPTAAGGYAVVTRPSPDLPEQHATYDRQGRLVGQVLPGGRAMLPASRQQIAAIWKTKLPD